MIKKQELLIVEQIKSINLDKREIVIKLDYLPFLTLSTEKADKLLNGLINRGDPFSDAPVRGLSLVWDEFTE